MQSDENNDELHYVLNVYGNYIKKFFNFKNYGANDIEVSFFANSEDYVDKIIPIKKSYTKYKNNSFKVSFYQDFSIQKNLITDLNECYIDEKKFLKIITPFTRSRSYDFIITKKGEMEWILKELSIRSEKANFHSFNFPVVGLDFNEIKRETIDFLMNEEFRTFCRERRIPLKRGLVLEGKPGTGKTLTLKYLKEQALQNKISFTSFSSPKEFVDNSEEYFNDEKKIFIFEDFDSVVYDRNLENGQPNAILAKILNVLEGVNEVQDVVSIFTTNKVELFDNAFLRPGRIDKVITYKLPNDSQILQFFNYYIEEQKEYHEEMLKFIKKLAADVSYAILKGICDDINIWLFSNKIIDIKTVKKIISEKISGANKQKEVRNSKNYIL